ncbi:MAG: substrate-binding domain-containing protein [Spirochaetes bacterium]|nr:substrate-binding domain-containing protein [Spirochaetota bacterium]
MKYLFSTALIFFVLFMFGCNTSPALNKESAFEIKSVSTENPVIGVSFININNQRQKEFNYFKELSDIMGLPSLCLDADGSAEKQKEQIEQMIEQKVKCIICFTYDDDLFSVIEKAKNQGIAIIRYDAACGFLPADYVISINYEDIGRMQGQWLLENIPEGNILILSGSPADIVAAMLHDSALAVIGKRINNGKYKILADKSVNNWDPSFVNEIFSEIPNIRKVNAVLAPNDGIAYEVVNELKKLGLNGKVLVSGMDGILDNCRNIVSGDQDMTIIKDWNDRVKTALTVSKMIINGNQNEIKTDGVINYNSVRIPVIYVPGVIIRKGNISEFITRKWYTKEELGL